MYRVRVGGSSKGKLKVFHGRYREVIQAVCGLSLALHPWWILSACSRAGSYHLGPPAEPPRPPELGDATVDWPRLERLTDATPELSNLGGVIWVL